MIAIRVRMIAIRVRMIATRVRMIAIRVRMIAIRVRMIATRRTDAYSRWPGADLQQGRVAPPARPVPAIRDHERPRLQEVPQASHGTAAQAWRRGKMDA
jgi:hypothetical protein